MAARVCALGLLRAVGGSGKRFFDTSSVKTAKKVKSVSMSFYSCESDPAKVDPKATSDCPIVILHEMFSSKEQWVPLVRALYKKTNRRVVVFDARNHGSSPHTAEMSHRHLVEDLLRSLKELDIGCATLIGHRMGGRVAMAAAIDNPDLVKDLVVLDGSPYSCDPHLFHIPTYLESISKVRLGKNITTSVALRSLDRQLRLTIKNSQTRSLLLSNVIQINNGEYKWKVNLVAIALNFPEIALPPPREDRQFFNKPTLFITGAAYAPVLELERADIDRAYTRAQFAKVTRINTILHYPRHEELLHRLTTFLSKQPPPQPTPQPPPPPPTPNLVL